MSVLVECKVEGCLIAQDGPCARTGAISHCENATESADDSSDELEDQINQAASLALSAPPELRSIDLDDPHHERRIHPGMELGLSDLQSLMETEYGHVVTILGADDAGKTSFLCSLYCMAARGGMELKGYRFSGSMTLPGFEARTRKSREWEPGKTPERLTYRTRYEEGRGAGFMHLDLQHIASEQNLRLFLTDLPGEWTRTWIDKARYGDRLAFLDRSDAILIMMDGTSLIDKERRGQVANQHKILIDRAKLLAPQGCALSIVLTRGDHLEMNAPAILDELVGHANQAGFRAKGTVISTFSGNTTVLSGTGVFEALMSCLQASTSLPHREPYAGEKPRPARFYGWNNSQDTDVG
ncbi:hypothetical protein FV242_31235 [Methylobacterium sp. WL64]|uniref:TRAFAC clade GTPase domain-containing protein n=1 Tax=Methylobacterium sp. WL64 TaxID=2603894 RepID=UPI0011C8FB36|nr:hypothetical protein [Methylobacterium sp. WL64]TXM97561.1 hypothetical protein FV242_31235 [Methylobacterium sp. WL64]